MAVSEAIYGMTTSYVSSSAYYGFVPQNNQHQQDNNRQPGHGNCGIGSSSSSSSCNWDLNVNMKQSRNENNQHAVGAMETDDESHEANIVNNYCVIPEDLRVFNPALYNSNYLDISQSQRYNPAPEYIGAAFLDRQSRHDAAAGRRRNRKRNNDGELMPVEPDQLKKLREGSGNGSTYHGRGFSKDGGLAKMYYKSPRLCLNREDNYRFEDKAKEVKVKETDEVKKEEFAAIGSCCWAAGNHSSLVNDDHNKHEDLLLNENLKFMREIGDLEYEKMLLETHGCSSYHHQRFESEF